MPVGLAVVLCIADLGPSAAPPTTPAFALSAADLAQTSRVMNHAPTRDVGPPPGPEPAPLADRPEPAAPDAFALLFGDRRDGGQFEMGALGSGRADAPGLVHVSVSLDF